MNDTIFAPLTSRGNCSIYVVRISGGAIEDCLKILGVTKKLEDKKATICNLKDVDGSILDHALLVYFKSPNSFTGEDVLELNLHCSSYIIKRVTSILLSIKNVRIAERGEFSKRAFLNGKLDLVQAEAILDLVNSKTEFQHKFAINQLKGFNSNYYNNLKNNIIEILSILEAYIDFPEEDISFDLIEDIKSKLDNLVYDIKDKLNDNKIGEIIKDGISIAIIGEPNSGKSTLLNYLSKRDVAIVSDIAGTTRDVIEVDLDIMGFPVIIYDTAGIRNTTNVIEKEGVRRAREKAQNVDLKILIIAIDKNEIDKEILDLIDDNTIILLNKIDLKNNLNENYFLNKDNVVKISLKNKINLDVFMEVLQDKLEKLFSPNKNIIITNERSRKELQNALEYLQKFNIDLPIEINTENIRLASNSIGRIVGFVTTEEILDNIFSKFCIGK